MVRSGERKVDETADEIRVDGVVVAAPRQVLWMLHKPAGYVTATEDPRERTVMELVPEPLRALDLKPVGRLDKDTEGLLSYQRREAAPRLISPRRHVWKRYYAEHEGRAGPEDQAAFAAGMPLGGGREPVSRRFCTPWGRGRSLVDLREGMYHQVRRMLAARGMPVTYLRRIAFGGLELGDLPPGQGREVALETVLSPPCDIAQAGSRWVLRDGGDGL